jgi:glycosyltransferase involved in cell wall biosynthesis
MCKHEEIMVSICCATYNHESYIADAIEGFLMQETNFKYEILIHDDASTDKTAEIIRTYEQKYPDVIKPIYQKVNQYSQGVKVTPTFNFSRSKGKYIALCEGDDYWTDPKKLQIQYDCLEKNSDVVCCYHSDYILDNNSLKKESRLSPQNQRSYTSYEMMACHIILPLTAFFRNIDALKNYPPETQYVKNGDRFLFSILGQYGSGMYLPMIEPAVYRVHAGGVWSMKTEIERKAMEINTWYWLAEYYSRLGNFKFEEKFKGRCVSVVISGLNKTQLLSIFIKMCIPHRVLKVIKKTLRNKNS